MANKEEVIFKVKAELQGFKKSMEDLKKVAKDSSKNIEKAMSMDLTDEGSKAGKSFAKGMNKELKSVTNALKNELKIMSDKTYTIKVKLDSSSVDRIKRDLSNIEIKVSASASNRANSSMSNNANAPNAANTMANMASTAALANLVTEVNKVAKTIQTTVSKVTESKVEVRTENVKVGVDTDGVKVGIDSEGVKVGVDTKDVKVGVDTEGVKVDVDTQNIQDVKVGVDTKDVKIGVDTKDAKVGVDAKGAKVGVDTYDTKVGVDTKDARVKIDENSIKQVKSIELDVAPIVKSLQDSGIKIDVDALNESVNALNEALNSLKTASENTKDGADKIADVISKAADLIKEIESAFNNGAKTVGTEIYESFNKSAQELYKDIVGLYKILASKMNEANKKSQVNNTYTTTSTTRKSNTLDDATFKPYTTDDQQELIKRPRFYVPKGKESVPRTGETKSFETDKLKDAEKSFRSIQDTINNAAKSIKEAAESIRANVPESINVNAPEQIDVNAPESIEVNLTPATDALDRINVITDRISETLSNVVSNLNDVSKNLSNTEISVDVQGATVNVDEASIPEIHLMAPEEPIDLNVNAPESIEVNLTPISDVLDKLNEVFNVATSGLDSINVKLAETFDNGAKTIGTEIYEAFTKSAQELYQDIVELYKIIAGKMSDSSKNQNKNTTTSTRRDDTFGSISWNEQQKIKLRTPFEAPNSRTPFTKTADLGNQYALFEIDKIKNADKAFQDIQSTISDVAKSMKELFKEVSESIKAATDSIKKVADPPKLERPHVTKNPKDVTHVPTTIPEDTAKKVQEAKEKIKNSLNPGNKEILKTEELIQKVTKKVEDLKVELNGLDDSSDMFAKTSSELARYMALLESLESDLKRLTKLNGFDEMCMTIEEADGAVGKLRMNLQLLSDDSYDSEDRVKKTRKEIDDIHEQISKLIDYRFKVFDKECEEKINNSFNNLMDAIEQGAKAMDAIIQKYGSNPLGEGKFDKESHTKVYDARENLKSKYNDFRDVISPPEMGWYITKEFEKEVNDIVNNAYNKLNDTINELEKSPSLIHADTVGENAIKLIEKAMKIEGDEEYTSSYKNRTTFNKLLDQLEKSMDDISEDDIPKHQEEAWKELRELLNAVRENIESIFKPMADDIFRKQKEQIEQMKVDADESYGSEAIRKGLNDVFKKLEEQKDKERRINKSKETVDEFDREFVKPLISDINKSSSSRDVKQDYTQAINRIVERMNDAFGKDTHKETVQEFEAALRQLEDRMENAPVKDVTKDIIKHIINRMREQIENAYEAYNLDLEVNLPIRSSLDVPAVINSIREQMDDVEQYVENNINLPIRSSLDVPDIRRNLDVIEVEFREIGETSDSLRDKLRSLFSVFGTKNAHVATHFVGQFNDKLNQLKESAKKVSDSIKDIGTPFKKAFNGISGIINKIISPIKKVTSGFRDMGNEAKSASNKVNGLTGSFKGLLSKLAMYFGIREIFNLFKTGTQDAMKYEAAIINLQLTYGKASQGLIDFANNHAIAFGLSKRQVAEYGNIYSAIMRDVNRAMNPSASADAIAKQTMDMSQGILESAGIISSALGYDMEYVLEGLRSGLLGSSQAVDQFGLNLKRANLENSKAFKEVANGVTSWEKLTVEQQQYVIAQEIINQTASKFGSILDENGKIMKTTASLHTQFLAQWQNTKLAVGNLGKVIWTAILPPLIKILAILEQIFNYAASAMTAILEMFNIKVDLNANLGGNSGLDSLGDTANDTSDALNGVGDSAQDTAKDTEDAAKKIKRALAGFDQINVLTLGDDAEDSEIETPELPEWNPAPIDPGEFGVQLPDLSDEFKAKLDKLKALFDEFMEPFKAAWDELGGRWIQAWNRLKESFKNFCDSLGDFLASVWNNGGKEFVQHMAEIALAVGIAAMEIGGTILDSLAKLWKHLDPETNMNTKGFIDALNEVSEKIRDLILDLNTHFESLMLNGGQDVLNALGDMFMNLGEAAVRGVGVVIDAIDGLLDHLDPATNKKTQGALGGLEYLFKSIGQFALGLSDAFATFMDNGGQEFLNNMGDIVMILIDMAATITGDLLNAITAFFDSWAGHVVITVAGRALELVSSILKGLLEILEPLTPIISGVVAAIGAFMVASKITSAVTTIVAAFQNLGGILGIAKAGFSALWAVLAANPVALTVAAIVGIGVALVALYNKCEWFRDAVNKVFDRIREPLEKLKETFSKIFENIVDVFQNIIDFIVGIFTGDGERAGKAVREFVINIGEILLGLFELRKNLAEIGWNLILGLVEGIWECIKNLPQLLAGIAEFIFDFFVGLFGLSPETAEKIKQIGRDIIDGICQGVMDAISAIGDFFGAIGDAIKQGIDNITSAEWWSDLGKAIAQPFIDAKDFIVELLGDIGSSISEWFSNKVDEALETLGKIKDFFSDIGKSAKEALDALREWASGLPEAIGNALSNLKTSIVEGPIGDLVRAIGDKLGEIKDVVSERFEIATKNASEKWGELTEELSGMLDDFIERNKERWERIKQDTAKKIEPIANEVIDKYTNMKDETCKALDDLMAKSEEAWAEVKEKIMEKLEPVVEYISGVWNRTKDAVVGAWEEITTNVSEAWDRFKDACMEVWDGIVEYMSGVWSRTKEAWIGAWNEIKEECVAAWDRVSEECIETWNETCEYLNGVWNRTKEAWVGAWNEIKEECSAAWSRVSEECINIWNDATEYLEGVWNRTRDAWIGAWEEIKTECVAAWDRFSSECIDMWNNTCDYVSGVWNRTKEAWIDAWNTIKEECGAAWTRVSEECKDMWDNTCEYISGVWNRTKDAWIDAWNVIEQECMAAWDRVSEECKRIWDNTCDYLEGVWDRTKDAWIDAWNVIVEESKAAWDRFSEECANIFGNIADVIVDKLSAISDFFTNLLEDIKNALGSMADGVMEFVGPKWDAIKDFFANIGSSIAGALLIIPGMIKDLFNFDIFEPIKNSLETGLDKLKDGAGLVEKAYSIGQFIIEGLFDGIKTTVEGIGTFLSGVYDIVIGFFKDIFGIHSPSKVFAELGGFLIEGLAQGITDSLNLLENIFSGVSDVISGAWDKIEVAWSGASDFFGGIWQSVKDTFDKIKDMSIPKPKIDWDIIKETASKTVGKVKETVEKFKADLPKPSVVWDSIKTTAERTISNVKTSVERFKAKLPKPELAWNDLKTTLTDTLDKLKETISKFKWELPKPKLPSFSVSGGKAPWGFMGQGSLPSIKIKWNAQGGIMNSPTIFGMTGNTLLGGGEAGAEAILPLDELWNRLDNSFQQQNQTISRAIASSNNGSNRPVNVVLKVNDIEMGKVVVNSLKSLSNHSGGSLDLPFNK